LGYCDKTSGFERKTEMTIDKRKETAKEAASIVKEEKRDKADAATASVVEEAAVRVKAPWLKTDSAARFVKKELGITEVKRAEPAAAAAKPVNKKEEAKQLARVAYLKWGQAHGEWVGRILTDILAKAEKDRGVKLAVVLLSFCDLPVYQYGTRAHEMIDDTKPAEEKPLTPSQSRLLEAAGVRTLESLLILVEACNPTLDQVDATFAPYINADDSPPIGPELAARLAKAFGVSAGDPPVYEIVK
jgi:hypothetical protein